MRVGQRTVQFEPGLPSTDVVATGLSAAFPLDSTVLGTPLDFQALLTINGSGPTRRYANSAFRGVGLVQPVDEDFTRT
ncbi:MAG: hypothetical protein IPN62_00005 [Flavobacteriales bacterium]|nr:hypothetical protein [Flavobacteriales bacterium]